MSTTQQPNSNQGTPMVPVDITKVDYTKDWDRDNPVVMHIFGRTKGGTMVHIINNEYRPYFYVPLTEFQSSIENSDLVTGLEYGFNSIYGEDMVKIYTRIPGDIPKLRQKYTHHEADILFPNRFLIDSGIEGSMLIPADHAGANPTELSLDNVSPHNGTVKSRVCYCDIEVDDGNGFPSEDVAEEKIVSITTYDNYLEEYDFWMFHEDLPLVEHDEARVHVFETEEKMMRAFCKFILETNPDVFAGWNFSDFDARYLLNRLERLADELDLDDLDENSLSPIGVAYDEGYFGGKIKGITVFDMLRAYKTLQFSELDSYSLEDVAQEELGVGKVKDSRGIREQWNDDPDALCEYNVKDVKLTVMLDEEQAIIDFYEEIANYVGGRLAEVIGVHKAVDQKILRAVYDQYVVPSGDTAEGEGFKGGKVFDPISGIKETVIVLDLKSLYPMCMKTINAGPDTKDPDGALTAPNGVSFSNDEKAIVVDIIDEMLEERQAYKDKRNACEPGTKQYKIFDRKQAAVKVIMNTLYGVMGWDRFRLLDEDVGAAVTATGRGVIQHTEEIVEDMGYDVTYGDTDSVMIELKDIDGSILSDEEAVAHMLEAHGVSTLDEMRVKVKDKRPDMSDDELEHYLSVLTIGFYMEAKINKAYDKYAEEVIGAEEHYFQIEFEKLYKRYFQSGRKKRYAGHITWKEGKIVDDIDVTGFEFKRSDYATIPRKVQQQVLDTIVRGGTFSDVSAIVREVISGIKNEEYDMEDLAIPGGISKEFEDYDTDTLHVRGSKYAIRELGANIQSGDKPKGMYVKRVLPDDNGVPPHPLPRQKKTQDPFLCWMDFDTVPENFQWDWELYIEKQIRGPLERIFDGTDWTWEEVEMGQQTAALSDFTANVEEAGTKSRVGSPKSESESSDIDMSDMSDDEMAQYEARKQLSKTQDFLEQYEGTSEEGPVTVAKFGSGDDETESKSSSKSKDKPKGIKGVGTLDDFEDSSDGEAKSFTFKKQETEEQPELGKYLAQ